MTPIEKNIRVVDALGNEYEATYPKRAKGLVKNGRARFVDETTICLACPPKIIMEDIIMSENEMKLNTETGEVSEIITNSDTVKEPVCKKYTLAYALDQIERLTGDIGYFMQAMVALESAAQTNEGTPVGGSNEEIAKAIAASVSAHEETVRQALAFYTHMVDVLSPEFEKEAKVRHDFLDFVTGCTSVAGPSVGLPNFAEIWKVMQNK